MTIFLKKLQEILQMTKLAKKKVVPTQSEPPSSEAERQAAEAESPESEKYHEWLELRDKQPQYLRQLSMQNSLLSFIVFIACLWILKITASFSIPIVLAIVIFMMLDPLVERLARFVPYGLACLVVLLLFILAVGSLLALISMAGFSSLLQAMPSYQAKLRNLISLGMNFLDQQGIEISEVFDQNFINKGINSAGSIVGAISGGLSNFFSTSFTLFLMLLFLLLEGRAFSATVTRSFGESKGNSIIKIYENTREQIGFYLQLKTLVSAATGLIVATGLWLLDVDFPIVWGILAFAFNFIPSIGSILHTLLVALFSLLQFSQNIYFVLVIIAFLLAVQFAIGNYVEPKMQGHRLRLSPVFILLALYIWGYIWGVAGMLLAVPILSVIKIICQNTPQLVTFSKFLENTAPKNPQNPKGSKRNKANPKTKEAAK